MIILNRWAIRQISTGHYLPAPRGRGGRGGSHVEPCAPDAGNEPRLFHTEHAAKIALTHWLKGKVSVHVHEDAWTGEYDETCTTEPVPSRQRADMEVVPVEVKLP